MGLPALRSSTIWRLKSSAAKWLAAHTDDEDIADVRVRFDTIGIYEALMRSISPLAHATASLAVGSKFPFGN